MRPLLLVAALGVAQDLPEEVSEPPAEAPAAEAVAPAEEPTPSPESVPAEAAVPAPTKEAPPTAPAVAVEAAPVAAPPPPAPSAEPAPATPRTEFWPLSSPYLAPTNEPAAPSTVVVETRGPALPELPAPPRGGLGRALLLALGAGLAWLLSRGAERLAERLRPAGLLPRLLGMSVALGRGLAVPLSVLALFALAPSSWAWAGPIALVTVAIALGWTSRDLLADLFAGAVLAVDRHVRVGERIEIDGVSGIVSQVGMRVTRLALDSGRTLAVPNRHLLGSRIQTDPDVYTPLDVPVYVGRIAAFRGDDHLHTAWVRQTLGELALLSPYLAPGRDPRVYRDPDHADVWIVQARVVHPRYADAFRGAMVELADEVFLAYQPPPGPRIRALPTD